MLTADDLAGMADVQEENLPDVCNVVTVEYVRDARGNVTETAVTGPDFACRIKAFSQMNASAQEALVLQRLGVIDAWKVKCARGADLTLLDRVLVDVAGGGERMMEINAAPGDESYPTIQTFYAVEIR